MAKKSNKKVTVVHAHPMHVPVSEKNPSGLTIRDQHLRHIKGTYLDREEIAATFKNYDKSKVIYPAKSKIELKNSDNYDDLIAVWTDYFNKKLNANPLVDPDMIKALIASESKFIENPRGNPRASGIAQITPETFKILQNPDGETKEFVFKDIRKKDLLDPNIAIPMGIRWIFRKRRLAEGKLGRPPTEEETILEYKGLLKSNSDYKKSALKDYKENYEKLKKK